MRGIFSRIVVAMLVTVACGSPDDPQHGDPPDAELPLDADRDGYPVSTDCNDGDPSVWRILTHGFRDTDGDHHTVAMSGMVCSGATLPRGYYSTPLPGDADCDDVDPAVFALMVGFNDGDGDGIGDGLAVSLCNGGSLPAGFVTTDGDCAPADAERLWTPGNLIACPPALSVQAAAHRVQILNTRRPGLQSPKPPCRLPR